MADRFPGLRHDIVVCRNYDDGNVGYLGTPCTHGRKGLVARGIQEGNPLAVFKFHGVGPNVLGNPPTFPGNHIFLPDIVEQGSFPVVYVAHNRYYRSPGFQVFGGIGLYIYRIFQFGGNEFNLVSKFLRYYGEGFRIKALVHGNHDTKRHTGGDNFGGGDVHHGSHFTYGNKLGNFKGFAFQFLLFQILLGLLAVVVSLVPPVFGPFSFFGFPLKFLKGFPDLLLYFLFGGFHLLSS